MEPILVPATIFPVGVKDRAMNISVRRNTPVISAFSSKKVDSNITSRIGL